MASWFSSAFESVFGVGSVQSMGPLDVLQKLPVRTEYSAAEADDLKALAQRDPYELVRVLNDDGHPKWAAAVKSAADATTARDDRHQANIDQTAKDIKQDATKATRRGASWLPVVGIVAAVVLLTQSGKR